MTAEMAMYFFGAKCSPEMGEGEGMAGAGGADDSKIAPSQSEDMLPQMRACHGHGRNRRRRRKRERAL